MEKLKRRATSPNRNGYGVEQESLKKAHPNDWQLFCEAIGRIKPAEPQEIPREKRERKKTVRPIYDLYVDYWIIRNPVPNKCKYGKTEYDSYTECRVVIKVDEREYWRTFWSIRGMEIIECEEDWTHQE